MAFPASSLGRIVVVSQADLGGEPSLLLDVVAFVARHDTPSNDGFDHGVRGPADVSFPAEGRSFHRAVTLL